MGDRLGEEESEKAPGKRMSAFTSCSKKGKSESPPLLKDTPIRPRYSSGKVSETKPRLSQRSDSKHSLYTTDSDSSAMEPILTNVKSMSDLENTECLTYEMVRRRARRKKFKCEFGSEGSGNIIQNTISPRPQFPNERCSKSPIGGVAPSMKSSLSAMSELSEYLDEGPSTSFEQMKRSTEWNEKMSTSPGTFEISQNFNQQNCTSVVSDSSERVVGGGNQPAAPPLVSPIFSPLTPTAVCRPISNYSSQHTDRCVSPLVSESKVKVKIVHRPISSRAQDPESKISILQLGPDKVQTVGFDPPQTRADKNKTLQRNANTITSDKLTTGLELLDEKLVEVLENSESAKNIDQGDTKVTSTEKSN